MEEVEGGGDGVSEGGRCVEEVEGGGDGVSEGRGGVWKWRGR